MYIPFALIFISPRFRILFFELTFVDLFLPWFAQLSTSPLSPTEQVQVADQVVSFMRKYWTEGLDQSSDAMPGLKYFTFAESEVFLNAIVSSVTRGGASVLTYELLEQQWIGQATTATIKGSVREEYDISEGLSRT